MSAQAGRCSGAARCCSPRSATTRPCAPSGARFRASPAAKRRPTRCCKIGLCHKRLGAPDRARAAMNQLKAQFPQSMRRALRRQRRRDASVQRGRSRVRKQAEIAAWGASLVLPVALAASLRAQEQPVAPVQPSADSHPVVEGRHPVGRLRALPGLFVRVAARSGPTTPRSPIRTGSTRVTCCAFARERSVVIRQRPEPPAAHPARRRVRVSCAKAAIWRRAATVLIGEQVYLDKDALKESARIVGSPDDHMMFSPSDDVYLKLAKGESARRGQGADGVPPDSPRRAGAEIAARSSSTTPAMAARSCA